MPNEFARECPACRLPYMFQSGGGGSDPDAEDESIYCPNCAFLIGKERTLGVPRTRTLSEDELQDWRDRHR